MSPRDEIYLDNSATTPLLPEVRQAIVASSEAQLGNPSSDHAAGFRAREAMRRAREALASFLCVDPESMIFTSGATEANNLVLMSAGQESPRRIVTLATEHSSILRVCDALERQGVEIVVLPVEATGVLAFAALREALATPTDLVSIHWVNGETGVMQPIEEICALCHQSGVPLHVDATQAVGRVPVDLQRIPIDYLSLSAHKFHGPPGVGALYVREGAKIRSALWGGDQEGGQRAGTENLLGIVGMGAAVEIRSARCTEVQAEITNLRDHFERELMASLEGVAINGSPDHRAAGISNLRFTGVDGQALVARLDLLGICCSQNSACTSSRPEPSYVLCAMGLSEQEAYSSVRFSFSELNSMSEVESVLAILPPLVEELRAFMGGVSEGVSQSIGVDAWRD